MTEGRRRGALLLARGLVGGVAVVAGAWLGAWHLWLGAAWWLALAGMMARPVGWRWSIPMVLSGLALVPWCVFRYTVRVQDLTAEVAAGGPAALGVDDLFAV